MQTKPVQPVKEEKIEKPAPPPTKKSDAACLEIIKKMNGFKDNVWKDIDKIETVELVLEDFGTMICMNRFKGIKSLTLINVGVSSIEGLTEATKLEELWLNENTIGRIEGLEKCVNLKSLYLSHNQIKRIEGLDALTKLQTLWICDNKIETIENLDRLTNLKQLWIAGNLIEYIKTSLDKLINLSDLNLSGNKICSFKQILNLNRLPNLRILSFYDPHFGQNPICNLCNYQTYVLYHLRNINKLDTLMISEDAKNFAQNTYMRKKMYYNMRIKTMQRSFSTLQKLVRKAAQIKIDGINEDLINMNIKLNELGDDHVDAKQLRQVYNWKIEQLNHVKIVFDSVQKRLFDTDNICIRKLITELETGGNIRLEEGKPTEKWYASCADLIKSRFEKADFAQLGINDIVIKRVIKIHNKFFKNKFEERMEALVDVSNTNTRRLIEYLFYGQDPNAPGEMEHVVEEGFRPPAEAKKLGLCPYTPLANTVLSADLPRLTSYIKNKKNQEKFNKNFMKKRNLGDLVVYPTGSMLICKVLISKNSLDTNNPYFNPAQSPIEALQMSPIDIKDNGEYAVYRMKSNESRHKMWFYLDNNIVQPEYIVEFDYVVDNPLQNHVADFGDCAALLQNVADEFISPKNISTYSKDINEIYNQLVQEVNNYQFENIEEDGHPNLEIQAIDLDRIDIGSIKIMLANYFKYCFSRSDSYYELNPNSLQQPSQDFDFKRLKVENASTLKYINLSNFKIKELGFLKNLPGLEILILSSNSITKLNDIEACSNLKTLDLSHNEISSLVGLASLKQLQYLDLSHNELTSFDSLRVLELNTKLREVNLLFNPFVSSEGLETYLYRTIKSLKCLNHKELTLSQSEDNDKAVPEITQEMIKQNMKLTQNKAQQHNWRISIECLILSHSRLSSMRGIQSLINLRQLNLSHNLIEKIDFIQNCKLIEELNLEENKITKIEHLSELIYLKKLELGKNRISKIEGIHTLNNLLQLSLQDNQLTTLEDFPQLRSLQELYLGNNKIVDTKEINRIKDLQKLIILDMSGNPLSRDGNYRMYSLFILKKLKVLDGNTIEGIEQQQAREHFTGRLTEEILRERLDGRRAEDLVELDLSNCRLKDFDEMFNHRAFPHLNELNLCGNEFTSVKMLGFLPGLKILILQSNRIETLFCSSDINIPKGLNGCQNLDIIDLGKNCLKDFNGLQFCKLGQLKILKAYQNELTKIDNLDNLRQLKELDVNHNKIKQFDVNSFEARNPLKCLKIDDNGLRNFNNIQKLVRLQHLFANSNRISEFHDIERLCELVYLKELQLNGNSLYRKPGYRTTLIKKLPNLLYLDAKEISPEERLDQQTIPIPNNPPLNQPNGNYIQQMNQRQMAVRMSSVNFQGVFTSNRLNMENLLSQNLYSRDTQPPPPRRN